MKPVVRCILPKDYKIVIGKSTDVIPLDYPRKELNNRHCYTSTVVSISDTQFETRNTIYKHA